MKQRSSCSIMTMLAVIIIALPVGCLADKEIVRPEEIKSKRQVVYDNKTYSKLAELWKAYYDAYPSEYAYANWMYAIRYAEGSEYSELLGKGLKQYKANPTLMYLKAIERLGRSDDTEGRKYLEQAIALDPGYVDPWFPLVTHYMQGRDEERLDLALRRLLKSGIIADEVMDYNYNMLVSLDDNAILLTNGDNDTYPGWILTRVLKIRPDVAIVNRSLLNTEWYPIYVIEGGVPRFISKSELDDLRKSILAEVKKTGAAVQGPGLFGDTLIILMIESAKRAGRPVYFSRTLYITDKLKGLAEAGRDLGLVTLVTSSEIPYAEQLRRVYGKWLETFRTAGLDGWRLRSAPATDAGRMLVCNYADAVTTSLADLKKLAPELRAGLFRWYLDHVDRLITEESRSEIAEEWCRQSDVKEIESWCKQQGMKQ